MMRAAEERAGRNQTFAALTKLPGVWRGDELEHAVHPTVATGYAALDRELPGGGWPMATLSEVLHDGVGIGEVGFLAKALASATQGERMIAWINTPHLPYAPALAETGIPLERCLVVRPENREDALWAAEQALKSGACGAVLFWLANPRNEYAWLRRLQMAAEAGRAMAVYFRAASDEGLSTPAHLRVVVARAAGGFKLRIPKRRGPPLHAPITLETGNAPPRKLHSVSPASFPLPVISAPRAVAPSLT